MSDGIFLALTLLVPLALALLALMPGMHRHGLTLLPLAPLPALMGALFLPSGILFEAPGLLLGAWLALDENARLFLGLAAFLWTAAGVFARSYMREHRNPARFCAFWCLTLAGNLGVFLAGDVVTFYTAFACVSLAVWPLIIESRGDDALRAGRVYIILAIFGEACLAAGFMLAASNAETLAIADMKVAIAASPWRNGALALLVAGFGIKAGLVPLHVWLPLAHPAAPTPASAVLSGAIVKAGIFGLMQFLPFGIALPEWHELLLILGLVTAFYGIAFGLTPDNPKTILAWSTISQMGIIVTVLAMALQPGAPQATLDAASLYALHHGLAKGALFMGVGVIAATGAGRLMPILALLAIPALSLAGAPLTGGDVAKFAIKPVLGSTIAATLVTLSAIGTALLMVRFLLAVRRSNAPDPDARPTWGLLLPWVATIAASLILPRVSTAEMKASPFAPESLWSALWPILIAAGIVIVARRAHVGAPRIPMGDLLQPMASLIPKLESWSKAGTTRSLIAWRKSIPAFPDIWATKAEHLLSRWSISGTVLLIVVLAGML